MSTLVRHKESGLLYRLSDLNNGTFYISANDGRVPSGQVLNGPIDRVLKDYPLELV